MLKSKTLFTALGIWFLFHIVVFFIIAPSGLEQVSNLGEKGVQVANVYNQVAGLFAVLIGLIMLSCRDLEFGSAKKVLAATGIGLVLFDVMMITSFLQNADEPALQTPLPAIVIWVVLTAWTLYVSLIVKES